ncbi:MAG: hypothetical protein Q9219_003597 [cf. Caloplaca sp. 3 TL-2023]
MLGSVRQSETFFGRCAERFRQLYLSARRFLPNVKPSSVFTIFAFPKSQSTILTNSTMAEPSIYDEIELEDLAYHPETTLYTYPCPCGDQFEITLQDLREGEDIAVCPSCSLMIRVIFEAGDLPAEEPPVEESKWMAVEVAA